MDQERADVWSSSLIEEYGSLTAVLNGRLRRSLKAVEGDHRAHALLCSVRECHLSLLLAPVADRRMPVTGASIAAYFQALFGRERTESVYATFLDPRHRLITCEAVARGSVDACSLEPSEIVLRSVDLGARFIILAHNHPSGDPMPSEGDYDVTRKLASACKVFGIGLLDHLIITADGSTSFRQRGLL